MTSAVLTPFTVSEAVELGNRVWRKRVLPVGEVEYKGRILRFTKDYLGGLVRSFNDRAYDQVPFQLADAQNTHTNDPERTRGEITAMELGDDGLYITAQLTPDGEKVLTANPKLGVSARIVEDYARSDGRHFPKAIQHVLGTLDPRIPGLGAWQAIEAASPTPDRVVDLSNLTFAGDTLPAAPSLLPESQPEKDAGMPDLRNLNAEQQARLAKLLELPDDTLNALAGGGMVLTPEELAALADPGGADDEDALAAEIDAMSDEDIAALEAEFQAASGAPAAPGYTPNYMPEGEPVGAGLTAEAQFAINLANARAEETQRELAGITARMRAADFEAEKRKLADLGVPPFITDMARPLLEGAGRTVELANGRTADAGQIMRRVLAEYAKQIRLLDLGVELGSPMDEPDGVGDEQQAASRADTVALFKSVTGLK